jgi:DnaK suppressor protein
MNKKDMRYFREILQRELSELTAKADIAVGELIETEYTNEADPLDRAKQDLDRNQRWRFQDREQRLIAKIRNCLQTIEDGTYGICEDCEEPIGLARLKARPVTSFCITCKTKQESLERITGP